MSIKKYNKLSNENYYHLMSIALINGIKKTIKKHRTLDGKVRCFLEGFISIYRFRYISHSQIVLMVLVLFCFPNRLLSSH